MKINEMPVGAVVVGVDGSQDSDQAVDWAVEHATNENRDLVLLHAAAPRADSRPVLDAAAARVVGRRPAGRVHAVHADTDPRSALLEASRAASVLVVGSRGRGPVAGLLLGSVSSTVAGHSHCPAVVVRPHHRGEVRRGVLVAVDGTESSPEVLDFAFRQASEKNLPLTVLHSEWEVYAPAKQLEPGDVDYAETCLTLAEAMAGLGEKYADVPVAKVVVRGRPQDAIRRHADAMHLVVVGHGRLDPLSRALFGSVALGVLEHARTVVAVVPQSR